MMSVIVRAGSLFLGVFTLLNLIGEMLLAGFDANLWWIDVRGLPAPLRVGLLVVASGVLIAHGVRPAAATWRRRATQAVTAVLLLAALWNAAVFYRLLFGGAIRAGVPVPFSLAVAALMAGVLWSTKRPAETPAPLSRKRNLVMVAAVGAFALAFPLGQMFCFGKTDYSRRADVAVVFGARAYADGRCSAALTDRVRTAVDLYRRRMVRMLIFSGGPGDGDVTEPRAMRRLAMQLGVPDEAILLDEHGLNTRATVANTTPMLKRTGMRRVLAVSHYYHLPRVKMAYRRADAEVYTVPADEQYVLTKTPYLLAREIAAFWAYYLRPGVS